MRPRLTDLSGSGSIEQQADKVLFIHRTETCGLDVDDEGNSTKGIQLRFTISPKKVLNCICFIIL
jgi:replicative DNA helicase